MQKNTSQPSSWRLRTGVVISVTRDGYGRVTTCAVRCRTADVDDNLTGVPNDTEVALRPGDTVTVDFGEGLGFEPRVVGVVARRG